MVKIQRKRAFHSLMQQLDIFPRQAVQFRPVKERSLCALHTLSRTTPALGETERDVWTAAGHTSQPYQRDEGECGGSPAAKKQLL